MSVRPSTRGSAFATLLCLLGLLLAGPGHGLVHLGGGCDGHHGCEEGADEAAGDDDRWVAPETADTCLLCHVGLSDDVPLPPRVARPAPALLPLGWTSARLPASLRGRAPPARGPPALA